MKFKVPIGEFQKRLSKVLPAIPPKATLPVLEHLNFKLEGGNLKIIATDQDITIMSNMEVESGEEGSVLVPGRKLDAIIKALGTTGEFEFESSTDTFEIKLVTPRGSYTMKGLNPNEYLDLPELFESKKPDIKDDAPDGTIDTSVPTAVFSKDEIVLLSDKTYFAVSSDEFRPAMTGVLFQFRETFVNAVSTDSYRLVKATVHADGAKYPQDFDVIIPSKAVELLRRSDNEVIMSFIETVGHISHARFDIGETIYITRVIQEKFPPYESVIPEGNPLRLEVNQEEITSAIRRVAIFTSAKSKQIQLSLSSGKLTIIGQDEETGNHAREEIPAEYEGDDLLIAFNHKYLDDSINNIDSKITEDNMVVMSFSEPSRPALVSPKAEKDELLMLIMPVRLS